MPTADYSSYHQNSGTGADGTKFSNFIDAVQATVNGLDNNNIATNAGIVASKLSVPYSAYAPTWAASGTQPVLGNGTLSGRFVQIGKLVHFYIHLIAGTTTTFGTGSYTFTLPVTGASVPGSPLGPAYALDSSASAFAYAAAIYATTTTFNVQQPATWPTGIQNQFGQTTPWTWATSDTLDINGIYEAA